MSDLISRQAAIDALSHMMDTDGFRDGWAVSRANVDCMLRSLPSAQPEIIRCKDCKYMTEHYDTDGNLYWTCDEWDSVTEYYGLCCHYAERRTE